MALLIKNLFFTLIVPGTVSVYFPIWITREQQPASGLGSIAAVAVFALGGAIYAWCLWDFASFGRGTPLPIEPPKKLVIRGLYRYSRNPMYTGVLIVIFGWSILFASAILAAYAFAVGTCFQLFIIIYEEPHLKKKFGQQYEQYCARVGRWLPRLPRADTSTFQ